jgi:hypothetical protein
VGRKPFEQVIRVLAFDRDRFVADLRMKPPPFTSPSTALFQLRYLAAYVADPVIDCKSMLIEEHYIDRDHMEDHSVFYSRNLYPYSNFCRRVHFFTIPAAQVAVQFRRLRGIHRSRGERSYRAACGTFSKKAYVGFAVIKPLMGTPVGRTILRSFPPRKKERPRYHRHFSCNGVYQAHVAGVELTVEGLPFQQQDKAVAACATTAVWSALHRTRAFEDIATFTPAQITVLATRASLEFGRPMPSEGLSIDQMCQAVQAVGASPVLRREDDFRTARGLLYSSIRSGVAPILAIVNPSGQRHAVAAVGMGLRDGPLNIQGNIGDRASQVEALYIHDDRIGPYLRADLKERASRLWLHLQFLPDKKLPEQWWMLTHVLFPMHVKVRASFGELRAIAFDWVAVRIEACRRALAAKGVSEAKKGVVTVETWIRRAHKHQEWLLRNHINPAAPERLMNHVSFSRYVGVIRVLAPFIDPIQVLIDTTSTERNIFALAVVAESAKKKLTPEIAQHIADRFQCRDRLVLA